MESFKDLILLVISLFLTKLQTFIMAIAALVDLFLEVFFVQFGLVILILYAMLRVVEKGYFWYMYHNYMHRKIEHSLSSFIDFKLFFKHLTSNKQSNGIIADLKHAKNQLHQYNQTELRLLASFLHTIHKSYRDLRPGVWVVAFLLGLLTVYILDIGNFEGQNWNFVTVLKTVMVIGFWYLITLLRFTNQKKKVSQMFELISTSVREKQEDSAENMQIANFDPTHQQ